jgi:hypothetical protein
MISEGMGRFSMISLIQQFNRIRITLAISFLFSLVGIVGVYVASLYAEKPVMLLTRDPAAVTGTNPFIGFLSNIGIMLWSATAAICIFGAILMALYNRDRRSAGFFIYSGVFTIILTLDDALLLHEKVFPTYLHIYQFQIYIAYIAMTAIYLLCYYRRILETDYILLVLALLFLGLAIISDSMFPFGNLSVFVEDSLKFMGIVFWLAYFSHATARAIYGGTADITSLPASPAGTASYPPS